MNAPQESPESADRTAALRPDLLVFAAVFLCYFFTSYRMGENERMVGVIALLATLVAGPRWAASPWPWAAVLGAMLTTLANRPLDVPNHHFMMMYLAAAIVLVLTGPPGDRKRLLERNARWLLVVLMGFATLQKAVSPTFLDGSYLGYEIARGGFGDPVLPLLGDAARIAEENDRLAVAFRSRPPEAAAGVRLEPLTPAPALVAKGFMVSILAIELLLFAGFLIAPRAAVSHLLLLSFIVTLGVLRQEFTFISVVAAMGMASCGEQRRWFRPAYGVLAILCAAAILKTLN